MRACQAVAHQRACEEKYRGDFFVKALTCAMMSDEGLSVWCLRVLMPITRPFKVNFAAAGERPDRRACESVVLQNS